MILGGEVVAHLAPRELGPRLELLAAVCRTMEDVVFGVGAVYWGAIIGEANRVEAGLNPIPIPDTDWIPILDTWNPIPGPETGGYEGESSSLLDNTST